MRKKGGRMLTYLFYDKYYYMRLKALPQYLHHDPHSQHFKFHIRYNPGYNAIVYYGKEN